MAEDHKSLAASIEQRINGTYHSDHVTNPCPVQKSTTIASLIDSSSRYLSLLHFILLNSAHYYSFPPISHPSHLQIC